MSKRKRKHKKHRQSHSQSKKRRFRTTEQIIADAKIPDKALPEKVFLENPNRKKTCSKCKKAKAYSEFRLRNKERQVLSGQCKECQHKREAEHRSNLSPEQKARNREYQKAYRKTRRGREIARRGNKRYYQKNKERVNARTAVHYAVMSGKLPHVSTLICIECGWKAENYHHHKGYERECWLNVVPVCIKCHRKIREEKAIYQTKRADHPDHPETSTVDQLLESP